MPDLVDRLLLLEADPVVTITLPLDRHRPGNDADRILLRNLLSEARSEVLDRTSGSSSKALLDGLAKAVDDVAFDQGAHGAVVVATSDHAESHLLSYPVRAAVAVESTPATRFLVQGLRRSPRYRVLVLSDRSTRLFEAVRDDLHEVIGQGFPAAADVVPRDLRAVAGRFARAPGRDDLEQWRAFYRQVDQALTEVAQDEPLPLVIVGVKRSATLFADVSGNSATVIGHVDGSHEHANEHELGELTWPLLRDHLRQRRAAVVSELHEAFHADRAVTGIEACWRLGHQGRGRLLVVEENFRGEPARHLDGELVITDEAGPDVMGDPVDELVEHLTRTGATCEFVAAGALDDLGHIGLLLR